MATGSSDWLALKVFALTRRGLLDPSRERSRFSAYNHGELCEIDNLKSKI
jgi:hypothetical protein